MYETFDHTADLGLRIRAADLAGLFEEAARAMFSVLVADLDTVRPQQQITLRIQAANRDDLLHDWLGELLYRFETEQFVGVRFDVKPTPAGLEAVVRGEQIDPDRHQLDVEVKAVTYHGLKVQPDKGGWLAEVILDI